MKGRAARGDTTLDEQEIATADGTLLCELWWASLHDHHPDLVWLLDDVERRRCGAYRRRDDRDRFTVAAALLRLVVGERCRVPAFEVCVRRTCPDCTRPHGRPEIDGLPVEVSVSHTGEVVVVAATTWPVGVDVERVSAVARTQLEDRVLGERERTDLRRAAGVDRDSHFASLWVRKEATLKATGDGLRVPLREIAFGGSGRRFTLTTYPGRPDLPPRIAVVDVDTVNRYAAAVSVVAPERVCIEHYAIDVVAKEGGGLLRAARGPT